MSFNRSFSEDPNNRGRTGDGLADLLLGMASGGSLGIQNGETAVARNYSFFFHDDWKLSNRLTLNLGLRWDRFGPPSFKDSAVSRFMVDFARQQYTIVKPQDEGGGCDHDNNNFPPRIGLARYRCRDIPQPGEAAVCSSMVNRSHHTILRMGVNRDQTGQTTSQRLNLPEG